MRVKTEWIQIRVSTDFKEQVRELADKENRTISNYVLHLLQQEINKCK